MIIKERKLFFTRNGNYSTWEMLNELSEEYLRELHRIALEEFWTETMPPDINAYPWSLFSIQDNLDELNKAIFSDELTQRFSQMGEPQSDFNAHLYFFHGISFDFDSIKLNLNKLIDESERFDIEGLEIEYFLYDDYNGFPNILDIRFTSDKNHYYRINKNQHQLNTELRIYLDLNIALMTNYSDYTHSSLHKNKFIDEIISSISSHSGSLNPKPFSDMLLRYMLAVSNNGTLPSKLKFEIDGRYKIGVDMGQPTQLKDIINQDDLKNIYNKYELSVIKVQIADDEEKCLSILGKEGKLISRAKNLDVSDVDSFVLKLKELLKYDYLYKDYFNDIKILAQNRISYATCNAPACQDTILKILR